MDKPKILIVDDHKMFAQGLSFLFQPHFEPTWADCAEMMLECIQREKYALVLLDLDLGCNTDPFALLAKLCSEGIRTMVVSGTATKADQRTVVALGARGFMDKVSPSSELIAAMYAVLDGHRSFPDGMLESLYTTGENDIPHLTSREATVLDELMRNPLKNNTLIATELHVSEGRVRNVLSDIFRKFGVNSRHKLISEAKRRGYYPYRVESDHPA